MIPDSLAAFIAFLGLVAPGLVFHLLREKHRPGAEETAFREASRIALASFVFTCIGVIVAGLAFVATQVVDIGAWISSPQPYVAGHYLRVALFAACVLAVSCLAAAGYERLSRRDTGRIEDVSVYYRVLRRDVPEAAVRVWIRAALTNGVEIRGALRAYTAGSDTDQFTVALGGSPMAERADATGPWQPIESFDAVILPLASIRLLKVEYLDKDGKPLAASASS